jgi:predicted ferric reductase
VRGVLIVVFSLIHVFLILAPEGLANLPIGKKFWPEMVGSLLLWVLVAMVISSRYREKLKLNYKRWRAIHKPLAYLATSLVVIHVLYVSDSFEQAVPRNILIVTFMLVLVRVVWGKLSARITQKKG